MLLICGLECWHTEKPFGSPDEDFYSGNSVVLRAGAEEVSSSSQLWSTLVSSLVFLWAWAFLASVCLHWAQRLPRALFPHSSSLLLLPTPIPNWALQGQNLQDASGLADIFIPKEPHITFWKSKFLSVLPHSWTHCSADITWRDGYYFLSTRLLVPSTCRESDVLPCACSGDEWPQLYTGFQVISLHGEPNLMDSCFKAFSVSPHSSPALWDLALCHLSHSVPCIICTLISMWFPEHWVLLVSSIPWHTCLISWKTVYLPTIQLLIPCSCLYTELLCSLSLNFIRSFIWAFI